MAPLPSRFTLAETDCPFAPARPRAPLCSSERQAYETRSCTSGLAPYCGHREGGSIAEIGDLVFLSGRRVPDEFRFHRGVVTRVAEAHCTVVVLDEKRRFGVGECWPNTADFVIVSTAWRLDARVCISGLASAGLQHLNGLSGVVVAHPRRGHPTFICKPSAPGLAAITLTIRMDEPALAGRTSLMLEARHLSPSGKDDASVDGGEESSTMCSGWEECRSFGREESDEVSVTMERSKPAKSSELLVSRLDSQPQYFEIHSDAEEDDKRKSEEHSAHGPLIRKAELETCCAVWRAFFLLGQTWSEPRTRRGSRLNGIMKPAAGAPEGAS